MAAPSVPAAPSASDEHQATASGCEAQSLPPEVAGAPTPADVVSEDQAAQTQEVANSGGNGGGLVSGTPEQQGPGNNKARPKGKVPTILGELNLKVTPRGIVLPESYKTLKQRWRERRAREEAAGAITAWQPQATLADAEGQKKRKAGKARQSLGVLLDDTEAALFHASVSGDAAACRAAVATGANVNVRTNADIDGIGTGGTALHIAAARGHADVAAALLSAGANATAVTGRGEAPIQLAMRMGHVDVVKLLKDVGASPTDAEGAMRLLKKAPAWDEKNKKRLMHAVLAPAMEERGHRRRIDKGEGGKGGGKDTDNADSQIDRSQYWLTGFEDGVSGELADSEGNQQLDGKGHKGFGRKGKKGRGKGKKGKGGKEGKGGKGPKGE